MSSDSSQPDRLARACAAFVGRVVRHPWAVLAACLGLAAASVHLAVHRLEYQTQRNDLLSPDKPCQQRWQKCLDTFGDDDDMVVVAEGTDPKQMTAALDAVADRVGQRPDLFDRVFHRIDLRPIHDRAIFFLSTDELRAVDERLSRMGPLLDPQYGRLRALAWQHLSLESLLSTSAAALDAPDPRPEDRDLLLQLPAVADSAAASLRDPAGYRNPWAIAGRATADRGQEARLTEPQYFFTPDGSLALLTCRPKKAAQSFTPAKEANEAMRAVLADVQPHFPGVRLGLTGLPVLETDEMVVTDVDSQRATWLALVGVAVLYFAVYRGFRYPLLTIATLLAGTVWALGWATLTVGHLNIITSAFAVMLIGMGDYGVLWVARYDEERQGGKSIEDAMRDTAAHAGPGILTAAVTTALAFGATMLSDFRAVAELGWIAGGGVLFCAASCLTLMPAALTITERWRAAHREVAVGAHRGLTPRRAPTLPFPAAPAWLPGLAARPRLVLGVGAVLLLGCGVFASRLTYDHNLLHLQSPALDSVAWEHKLIERNAGATWDALSIARSREEALALKAKYEALPEVGRVVEVASLVPAEQEAKLPVVRAIHARLDGLPPPEAVPPPTGSDPARVRALAAKLRARAARDTPLSLAAANLLAALDAAPDSAARLREFDRRLAADLAADLRHLRAVSRPEPITATDLPPEFRARYVGADGEFLVRAFAKESLWDYPALQRFTAAASTADPQATGKAYRTIEGLHQMRGGFERAGLYAVLAIVLVLFLDFRRVRGVLLGLFPLVVGAVLTAGVLGLCGVPLNPANMIALPLIVGVSVDNGVHVLHDHRQRNPNRPYAVGGATGKGVLVAGLTTVLGFGTLMIGRHRGMESLGLALSLGVTFSMLAALVWLPAVLRLLDGTKPRAAAAVLPMVRPKAA
jgi:hopanoid biosynthesis associated RND transporter like protein HpnN